MTKKLTARGVAALKPGPRREVKDGQVPGMAVTVGPRGPSSWVLRYRRKADDKLVKMTLGSVYIPAEGEEPPEPVLGGPMTLAGARKVALAQRARVDLGHDPAAELRAADDERRAALADTYGRVVDEYYARYASKKNRSADAVRDMLKKEGAAWLERPIRQITRRDVRDLLDGIVDRGAPVQANRVRSRLGHLFAWAQEREIVDANPARDVARPSPERERERWLDDGELAEVWRAAETLGDPWGPLAKVLILTGQRLGEVEAMRWQDLHDLHGDAPVWRIPAEVSKNGVAHDVPLPVAAAEVIRAQPRKEYGDQEVPFVFWSGRVGKTREVRPLSGRSKFRNRWREAVNAARTKDERDPMTDWRPHDLRRTCVSGMARLGVPVHVAEIAVNHRPAQSLKGVARVYNRYDYAAEQRQALAAWAEHVEAAVARAKAENVVALHG